MTQPEQVLGPRAQRAKPLQLRAHMARPLEVTTQAHLRHNTGGAGRAAEEGTMLRNRTFVAVSVADCAAYIGIGLVGPVRILYAQSRGASLAIVSALASAYLLSNFAGAVSQRLACRSLGAQTHHGGRVVGAGAALARLSIRQ